MRERIEIAAQDGAKLIGYLWRRESPKAVVAIVHGLAEYCLRYDEFAGFLNANGYAAISIDLRGHGETAENGMLGHFADKNGDKLVTGDVKSVVDRAKREYPRVPVILFAHSMGATFGKAAMIKFGDEFEACILSGDTLNKEGLREIAPAFTWVLSLFGRRKPSKTLSSMTFGMYNSSFEPARTKFDWLSRDPNEVDKYVDDKLCGFDGTPALYHDVAKTILFTLSQKNIDKIPKDMKIFIISGAKDPCGSDGKDIKLLYDKFKKAGLDAQCKLYDDARHELLNETNRAEVMGDILNFLERVIA
jgi:alpha-beta hydrolase superfamily lysophospholipase